MSTAYERARDAIAQREDREQVTITDVLDLTIDQLRAIGFQAGTPIPEEELAKWARLSRRDRRRYLTRFNPGAPQ